jgi:hypothetical protein
MKERPWLVSFYALGACIFAFLAPEAESLPIALLAVAYAVLALTAAVHRREPVTQLQLQMTPEQLSSAIAMAIHHAKKKEQ